MPFVKAVDAPQDAANQVDAVLGGLEDGCKEVQKDEARQLDGDIPHPVDDQVEEKRSNPDEHVTSQPGSVGRREILSQCPPRRV